MGTVDPILESDAELPVREGQVLDGKFRVERIVGEGAMGLVVEATHLGLDERVALKFLRREARSQPDVVARFSREARSAVKLKSDHVARVFDVGTAEDGTPFIVMEFLEGSDLATILELRRRLDVPEAVEYVIQACEGLTEAHTRGIVHRDIKPENLFLAQGAGALKQIKLLDFGISKAALSGGALETDLASGNTTQIMGSPHYMSPDQLRSTHDVDGRADIWSLGVVLFELVSGHMPFTATDVTTLIAQVLHEPHRRLTSVRSDAPPELEAVIDRCLAKDPAARYASAADLAIALLPFAPKRARHTAERAAEIARASGTEVAARADSIPPPPSSVRDVAVVAAAAPRTPPPQQEKTSPVIWILAGLVLLLGIGGGLFALFASNKPPAQGTAATTGTPTGNGAASAGGWATIPADNPGSSGAPREVASHDSGETGTPSARPTAPKTVRQPVAPPATTTAAKPVLPRPPETDIRMER
ncbi:MAG: serine/threonine protein kinase [Deltaproteobacteria bacterium]|nr:serine/threonine protein kinase [Deltaproteobacteria bacterium]